MTASDETALLAIFTDPNVMAAFHAPPFSQDQMRKWIDRNLKHQIEYGYGLFSVFQKSDGALIGNCGLERMELDGQIVHELGYDFLSSHWNRGYATEAATAVRDHAFARLRLPRLISLIRVGNEPSRRVAEKIGMRLVTEISRHNVSYWMYEVPV
ncbi:acetyltransferase, GNAT family protein [Fimbriimonas ginsengisoli Gsoil 348]|uniref:Acetyltransferase, GNAT family protein n=2 Tax=Fimbriimonas ginsengisoli TaxID=1005039 RepID=A0A068NQ14_FIMGI|nr:acetyltransferase, GNAT family protein [Fimbriimonas ginsengisoli Gsoil 348]